MKLKFSPKPTKPASDTLYAILLTDQNLEAANKLLANHYDGAFEMYAKDWKEGKIEYYYTPKLKFVAIGMGKAEALTAEKIRSAAQKAVGKGNDRDRNTLALMLPGKPPAGLKPTFAMAEAVVLANYQFLNYKTEPKKNSLRHTTLYSEEKNGEAAVKSGQKMAEATQVARDLVNEPVITLTAPELAARAEKLGKKYGFKVEVFNKAKIQSLKMGGLLSVNLGSILPPTFTIMEWAPKNATNKEPVVLVGKGVVYDTGGLSLKPTANSMDFMKSDMAGAAAVIGTMCALASLEVPYRVIGLVPATDNRPGQNAYTPGDVITMFDGSTVEVLNTDAEGRLLLADALSYAKKYKPSLVIDLATLTGAAVVALGHHGIAMMSNADKAVKEKFSASGEATYERVVELPLWEEYGNALKSEVADIKNVGGRPAGSITAGKFLEHFVDYPWIHLDIAGPSYLFSGESYRPKGGTGVGVRLLTHYIQNLSE